MPGPWCLAQELETGIYTRVCRKAFNIDSSTELRPAIFLHQAGHDHLQGNTMQWIQVMGPGHLLRYLGGLQFLLLLPLS